MATTAPAKSGSQAPPQLQPFRAGTQPTVASTGFNQTTSALGATTQNLPLWQIPPSNILRCIYLEVTCVTSGNSATVAFQGDAPLNVFQTVNFADAGGTSIVGSFDSYTLAMVQKYGGYANNSDPRANAQYKATTGSGGTGGSFTIVFRIPVEIVSRTGIGSLQNQSTNSPFTLQLTVNTSTAIYSTAPTTLAAVTVVGSVGGYWKGSNAAASQTPRAYGTTSYWNRAAVMGLNGAANIQLPNIGLGNPVRNLMFIDYDTGSARSDTHFPSPLQVTFRGNNLVQLDQTLWKFLMSESYFMTSSTQDAALGLDTGVYVLPFNQDFDYTPGSETGSGYLVTNVGDSIGLIGTWGASSTLYEVINYLAVKGAPTSVQGSGQ